MTTTEQATRYSVANQSDAYATDACILTDCGTEGLCGQWYDYRTSSQPSTDVPAGKRVCTRCLDVLHAYALKINPRGVIEIEITGSEHGWGTRIVQPCRMDDGYICGVTGTKTCTSDPKEQAGCPSC